MDEMIPALSVVTGEGRDTFEAQSWSSSNSSVGGKSKHEIWSDIADFRLIDAAT
jgi:hypothetical protein